MQYIDPHPPQKNKIKTKTKQSKTNKQTNKKTKTKKPTKKQIYFTFKSNPVFSISI
jgi:hypothetical protein